MVYDILGKSFETLTPGLPIARVYPGCHVLDMEGKLVIIGGVDKGLVQQHAIDILDLETEVWSSAGQYLPTDQQHFYRHLDGRFFAIGVDPNTGSEYDEGTGEWNHLDDWT